MRDVKLATPLMRRDIIVKALRPQRDSRKGRNNEGASDSPEKNWAR